MSFSGGSDGKESTCNEGDLGPVPGLGRPPGEGSGYTLQYSGLEKSMGRGAWQAKVHGVAKSRTWLSNFDFTSKMWGSLLQQGDSQQSLSPYRLQHSPLRETKNCTLRINARFTQDIITCNHPKVTSISDLNTISIDVLTRLTGKWTMIWEYKTLSYMSFSFKEANYIHNGNLGLLWVVDHESAMASLCRTGCYKW